MVQLCWEKPYQKVKGERIDFLSIKKIPLEGMEGILPYRSVLKKVIMLYE